MDREVFGELTQDVGEYADAGLSVEETYLVANNNYDVTEDMVRTLYGRHCQSPDYTEEENWEDLVNNRNLRFEKLLNGLNHHWELLKSL